MNPFKAGDMVVWVDGMWPQLVGHTAKVHKVRSDLVFLSWITGPRIDMPVETEGWLYGRVQRHLNEARLV